jgi:hypothetical protein
MTTLTMRYVKGHFVITGPDVPPMKFKSRPEARDWCKTHNPRLAGNRDRPQVGPCPIQVSGPDPVTS